LETERRELEMYTANALWCDRGFSLKEEYAKSMKADYWAEARALDFKAEASAETVNTWASENTRGRIPLVVNADVLRDSSPLIAMNAVYFRGLWEKPFEEELTKDEPFTLASGAKKLVPMMQQTGEFGYSERGGTQVARLAYKGGMSMYVVLPPKKTAISKFCAELRETGTDWTRYTDRCEGCIRMPRFRMEGSVDLTRSLEVMGISRAFDSERAAFDGIGVGDGLFLRGITQSDFIEVNEKGTEAAAVTKLMCLGALHGDWARPFEMTVDRPFLFAICDDYTSTIVFLGIVVNPKA
jgi:serpin B